MKRKITINTIAIGNLKQRKKQYAVMIIGIILAMVFSSGIIFFASCIQTSSEESKNLNLGKQNIIITSVTDKEIEELSQKNIITDYANFSTIGYGYTDKDEQRKGISIAYMDEKARDVYYLSFAEGNYPQNEGEIAIEKSALAQLKLDAKVGDTINLNVLPQNGYYCLDEPVAKSYKLVGIVNNKRSNHNIHDNTYKEIPAGYVSSASQLELGGKVRIDSLVFVNTKTDEWHNELWDICAKYNKEAEGNFYTETFYEQSAMWDISFNIIIGIVFTAVLLLASCLGIINAFSANLNDRKRQIGMLKTVGATKRQIINIFGREAFIITLICLPLSLLISYFGVKLISNFMEGVFVFKPNYLVLIGCGLFSLVSVMLAALIPLIKTAKISPIQAIRNLEFTRIMKKKKIKTQKSFNTSKLIAKRSLFFNRSRQVLVSFFLILTIVASGYGFAMVDDAKDSYYQSPYDYLLRNYDNVRYPIYNDLTDQNGYTENDRQEILSSAYIKEAHASASCEAVIKKSEYTDYDRLLQYNDYGIFDWNYEDLAKVTPENFDEIMGMKFSDDYLYFKEKCGFDKDFVSIALNGYDADVIKKLEPYITDGKIDIDKINSGEEIILYAPQKAEFVVDKDGNGYGLLNGRELQANETIMQSVPISYKVGDKLDLSVIIASELDILVNDGDYYLPSKVEHRDTTVTIGAIVSKIPRELIDFLYNYGGASSTSAELFTTNAVMRKLLPELKYSVINVNATGEIDDQINTEIMNTLNAVGDSEIGSDVYSNYEYANNQKREIKMVFVCLLAIVILLIAISASIINNSLSAQIRASKREIGTLRAVGASQKELVYSYVQQLVSILGIGYALGFGAYGVVYLINIVVDKINNVEIIYSFTVWRTIIACIALFVVCSVNLWLKIRKEMKNSIIENIREL